LHVLSALSCQLFIPQYPHALHVLSAPQYPHALHVLSAHVLSAQLSMSFQLLSPTTLCMSSEPDDAVHVL
jgi:hypothetical protein